MPPGRAFGNGYLLLPGGVQRVELKTFEIPAGGTLAVTLHYELVNNVERFLGD